MTNNINHFKENFDNAWIKHSKDQFRAPNAQDMEILIQTCLIPLAMKTQYDSFIFVHKLKQEMHADLKYVESLEKEIDEHESDKGEFSNMYDMILQECVSNDVMCSYLLSLSDLDALDELQCLYLYKVKEWSPMDKIICDLDKTPDLSQRPPQNCPKCGNPADGHYCQGCALLRKKFKEDLFTYYIENGILQDSSEPSNDNTNVVNALQEPFVVKQDPVKIPHKVLHISTTIVVTGVEEEKQIEEEQAAKARYWKIRVCYDDDDEDYTIAITPKEPDNSLSMGDEHLDIVLTTKSDEFIKSSVENLVPNPSESEGEHECDVPACEDFTTFSNILFDADYDFYFSDDQSFYDEDIPKEIYSNPLFDEEIISIKIDPHYFNAESDLIESLLNHDSLIFSSSSNIDSLFDEFASELTLLKSIPPGINETDYDPEEETRLIKRLLYDNSSPRPPKEFIFENSDAAIVSFSPFPIPVEDSDSFMEEIDLSFTPNDPMPLGIEKDD
nr:hypothetical protein [Tanacetum cinerariifolium]